MPKIKTCQFNIDTTMIDVIYENGSKISVYTVGIEESLRLTPITRDKLSWLLDNEPETYVQMVVDGTIQDYLDRYEESSSDCESGIRKSLEQKFSPEIARQIAREMMMYG